MAKRADKLVTESQLYGFTLKIESEYTSIFKGSLIFEGEVLATAESGSPDNLREYLFTELIHKMRLERFSK